MSEPGPCWVDGRLVARDDPALAATDSAFASGRGCYTTARCSGGHVALLERHVARLVRDARRLEIGEISLERAREALEATARAAFGSGEDPRDGIVRIQASRRSDGRPQLVVVPRSPGSEPASWRACLAPFAHEGPMPWSGAKVSNHLLFALAGDHARAAGVDEAILADREGYTIEGSRSNLLVVDANGGIATPDPSRGGVTGVGLELLRERAAEIRTRHLPVDALFSAQEVIAVNAIRGPRPVLEIDGRPIGSGTAGPVAARLEALFDAE